MTGIKNEKGFVVAMLMVLLVIGILFSVLFVRFRLNNETTSGIAYNTTNDRFISGATKFSIRAGENTLVTEENQSVYCLPPNSPYKELVNKAASDKKVKITVISSKYFAVQAPWVCNSNVVVTELK